MGIHVRNYFIKGATYKCYILTIICIVNLDAKLSQMPFQSQQNKYKVYLWRNE